MEQTLLIPAPGHWPNTARSGPPGKPTAQQLVQLMLDWQTGINPLVAAANPLLGLAVDLRQQAHHPDPAGLRETLAQAIALFESRAQAAGVAHSDLLAARYALCTLLDEAATSTPWGEPVWAQRSLLVQFHNEAWGGEKFFLLLRKLVERPHEHRSLLELFYLILALGFEGRYRVLQNGRTQLSGIRERLAQLLARQRGPVERELSPHWRSDASRAPAQRRRLPPWVFAALAALLLALVYAGLSFALNRQSDPIFSAILALRVPPGLQAPPSGQAPERLARLLAAEIAAGTITVRDLPDRSLVVAQGDQLFLPGSATVSDSFARLLERIGAAAAKTQGQVLIRGHTDARPIRSVRFPSNWHLSLARADATAQLLLPALGDPARLRTEGLADSEPVASNQSAEGRARNRRVEIVLYASAPGS